MSIQKRGKILSGITARKSADTLVLRRMQVDALGAIISTGTTTVRLLELQNNGSVKSFDFNDNTFKTTTLTTATASMVHQTTNNSVFSTGIWTYVVSVTTGFTVGKTYIAYSSAATAIPILDCVEFLWGSQDGDPIATKL